MSHERKAALITTLIILTLIGCVVSKLLAAIVVLTALAAFVAFIVYVLYAVVLDFVKELSK